jgi:hypothetical protein
MTNTPVVAPVAQVAHPKQFGTFAAGSLPKRFFLTCPSFSE